MSPGKEGETAPREAGCPTSLTSTRVTPLPRRPLDTEGVHGTTGAAPGSPGTITGNKAQSATETDTTGSSVAGIGVQAAGGSVTDVIPWAGAGQAGSGTGQPPQSDYAVRPVKEGIYGFPSGQPDVSEVYGGTPGTAPVTAASPYPWVPSSTAIGAAGVIDTQVSGGSALTSGLGAAPAYRAPSAGIAASVKDTTLTDILGNQIAAMTLTDSSYGAVQIDTSYIGAPAAPSSLLTQVDTFATSTVSPVYASKQGIVPSTLVVQDTTSAQTLVLNTDYTVTTALNGQKTSLYITLIHVSKWTTGDAITLTYSYGTPQYYDSNLPAAASQTVTDTLWLTQDGDQLQQWGVTTAASALTVFDVTQNAVPGLQHGLHGHQDHRAVHAGQHLHRDPADHLPDQLAADLGDRQARRRPDGHLRLLDLGPRRPGHGRRGLVHPDGDLVHARPRWP